MGHSGAEQNVARDTEPRFEGALFAPSTGVKPLAIGIASRKSAIPHLTKQLSAAEERRGTVAKNIADLTISVGKEGVG